MKQRAPLMSTLTMFKGYLNNLLYRLIIKQYTLVFSRPLFYRLNTFLITLGLHGIGVNNFQNESLSGEKFLLEKYLKPLSKVTVIDVGAHDGDTIRLIKSIVPKATIYSFEPNPNTYSSLLQLTSFKDVRAYNLALGAKNGKIQLYDPNQNSGSPFASVYKTAIEQISHRKPIEYNVKMTSLDYFCKNNLNNTSIDLLKIDVEGHEVEVLKGAKGLLKRDMIRMIQFEFNSMNLASRTFFYDFEKILANYNLFRLLPSGLIPVSSISVLKSEIFLYQNIVAVKKS